MNLSVILCAVDFSAATSSLISYAGALAVAAGAELRLLHVREQLTGVAAPSDAEASWLLEDYKQAAIRAGLRRVSTSVRSGEAAREIVAEAAQQAADLLMIGAHGCTNLTRFLVGSTAEQVLRQAPCRTIVVSSPEPAASAA